MVHGGTFFKLGLSFFRNWCPLYNFSEHHGCMGPVTNKFVCVSVCACVSIGVFDFCQSLSFYVCIVCACLFVIECAEDSHWRLFPQ